MDHLSRMFLFGPIPWLLSHGSELAAAVLGRKDQIWLILYCTIGFLSTRFK